MTRWRPLQLAGVPKSPEEGAAGIVIRLLPDQYERLLAAARQLIPYYSAEVIGQRLVDVLEEWAVADASERDTGSGAPLPERIEGIR